MPDNFNKNERQKDFNTVKGRITEWNDGDKYCSVTLECGHEKPREVNLVMKKSAFDTYCAQYPLGTKVSIKFFLTSMGKFVEGLDRRRWSTMANVLDIEKVIV